MRHNFEEEMNVVDLEILDEILDACKIYKLDLTPSQFYEKYMVFPKGSAIPGPARYSDSTPYWEKVVNCFAPGHPARDITIMGPAQMGKSAMVLQAIIIYLISQNPCNILFLTGHSDLTARAMSKLDAAIYQCGMSALIQPSVKKARGGKTGDTAMEKEFIGGNLLAGSVTNHNMLRQNDVMVTLADDLDAGRRAKKDTGNTVDLIKGRTKAFDQKCKRGWISTPQVKGNSLIEDQFEKSDKEYYNIPCPNCYEPIPWSFRIQIDDKNEAGIVWKLDKLGRVDPKTVEYCCQKCAGHFSDKKKYELLKSGLWVPTCEPAEQYHYGFGINGLYAPHGMTSWYTIAEKYVLANPVGLPRNEESYQTWKNLDMGELYEPPTVDVQAGRLAQNTQPYTVGTVPEALSEKQGNGKVVLLTCACDLGGRFVGDGMGSVIDDVRMDVEVLAHTESGSTYSIMHTSIGTFKPAFMNQNDPTRLYWSYDLSKPNNVWGELDKILGAIYTTESGHQMKIGMTCIDTGYGEHFVFNYIDRRTGVYNIVGIKGDKEHKYIPYGDNTANFKVGATRSNLYILKVSKIKDRLAGLIQLSWDRSSGEPQPPGFLNFPMSGEDPRRPGEILYSKSGYFAHYEAEERKLDKDKNFIWMKKVSNAQNHFFDCAVYGLTAAEIFMSKLFRELKVDPKTNGWPECCQILLKARNGQGLR